MGIHYNLLLSIRFIFINLLWLYLSVSSSVFDTYSFRASFLFPYPCDNILLHVGPSSYFWAWFWFLNVTSYISFVLNYWRFLSDSPPIFAPRPFYSYIYCARSRTGGLISHILSWSNLLHYVVVHCKFTKDRHSCHDSLFCSLYHDFHIILPGRQLEGL